MTHDSFNMDFTIYGPDLEGVRLGELRQVKVNDVPMVASVIKMGIDPLTATFRVKVTFEVIP